MRYRVEIDREPRAKFAKWVDALRFAKAAAAVDEERTVQVIETSDEPELILSMRHGKLAILGSYSYTLPEERARARVKTRRGPSRRRKTDPSSRRLASWSSPWNFTCRRSWRRRGGSARSTVTSRLEALSRTAWARARL